jgi:hypothetical protein
VLCDVRILIEKRKRSHSSQRRPEESMTFWSASLWEASSFFPYLGVENAGLLFVPSRDIQANGGEGGTDRGSPGRGGGHLLRSGSAGGRMRPPPYNMGADGPRL